MKCKNCGAELKKDDLFCTNCGKPVECSENNKKTGIIVAVAVAAVVVIAAVAVIVGFSLDKNGNHTENNESTSVSQQENVSQSEVVNAEQTTFKLVGDIETTTVPKNDDVCYVSSSTPDDAGIVVRKESTHYSDKITVLSEGTPVRVVSGFAPGTEYIHISFDFNGSETYGWVLGKYIVDKNFAVYGEQYNQPVSFKQKQANVYVSNITETGMQEFVGTPNKDEILKFVMNHSILNYNPSASGIEYGNFNLNGKYYDVRVNAEYIDRLSVRFFGTDINAVNMNDEKINTGCFYGNSTGVHSMGVAFVTGVYSNPSANEYKIKFSVYLADTDDESVYYSYTPAQAESDNSLNYSYDGYVILKKYTASDKESYKIVEYKRTTGL